MADDTPQVAAQEAPAVADNSPPDLDSAFTKAFGAHQDLDTAFHKAFTPGKAPAAPEPEAEAPKAATPIGVINMLNPDGDLVGVPGHQVLEARAQGFKDASPTDVANHFKQEKYGSTEQMLKAGLEGAAQGATFGLSTAAETGLGIATPEDIRNRAEVNPGIHNLGQIGGLAASSLIPGVGEAGLLRAGGEGAAGALGLGAEGASFINQVGADAVKGAFEAGLFQGGEEVSKAFTNDPNQTAGHAISDIGLATVLGGTFSGALGAGLRKLGVGPASEAASKLHPETPPPAFVSEVDQAAMEAGDFKASVENSNLIKPEEKQSILKDLTRQKPEAPEIKAAAERLGAPVMEGMTSASPLVQKAEDSLINGVPTFSGIRRAKLYEEGYHKASQAAADAMGEGSPYSKAEVGNIFKTSIPAKIQEDRAPISAMYDYIKQHHQMIPVDTEARQELQNSIKSIDVIKDAPKSPAGKLAKDILGEMNSIKTADDIKRYKTGLFDRLSPTASPAEKKVVSIVADRLTQLEDGSVEAFAKSIPKNDEAHALISSLVQKRKEANAAYKPFIENVTELLNKLGKKKVYGAGDAINYIKNELTPEQLTQRLFSKNDSEFLTFFKNKFPEEMEMMRQYQKGVLKDQVSKAGEFSPKTLFNKVNSLEPEIQKAIFTPEELNKLKDSETYLRSFPKNFNPSGTAGMSAFREFFHSPTGAAVANARDFGIESFIKAAGASSDVKNANVLARATVSGFKTANKAVRAALNPENATMPASIASSVAARDKIKKFVDEYSANPDKLANVAANVPVPEYKMAFSALSVRAVQYLNSLKPATVQGSPLDSKIKPSTAQQAIYNRAIDLAQTPLLAMDYIKNGTLTPQDVQTLQAVHPDTYKYLSEQAYKEVSDSTAKGRAIPYKIRLGLSLFIGQPLDSTMSASSILAAQPSPATGGMPPSAAPPQGPKRSTAALNKLPGAYRTQTQTAEEDRSQGRRD